MTNLPLPAVVLAAALCATAGPSVAQGAHEADVDRLVEDLASPEWTTREEASHALIALGREILPRLRELADHGDPEVRGRIAVAIEALTVPEPIETALGWLAAHQGDDPTGAFDRCPARICPPLACDGRPGRREGRIGLVLLALLGGGHSHTQGLHKDVVKESLKRLKNEQAPDGRFAPLRDGDDIDHLLASCGMVEAFAATRSPLLRATSGRSLLPVQASARSTQPAALLFGYLALQRGSADLDLPPETRAAVLERMRGLEPTSAMAAAASLFARRESGEPRDGRLLEAIGPPAALDPLERFVAARALYAHGGEEAARWLVAAGTSIVDRQRYEGHLRGSWDPVRRDSPWSDRVATTALETLSLEIVERFEREAADGK